MEIDGHAGVRGTPGPYLRVVVFVIERREDGCRCTAESSVRACRGVDLLADGLLHPLRAKDR